MRSMRIGRRSPHAVLGTLLTDPHGTPFAILRAMRFRTSALVLSAILGLQVGCAQTSAAPSADGGTDGGDQDVTLPGTVPEAGSDATDDADRDATDDADRDAAGDTGNGVYGTFGAACIGSPTCDGGLCLFPVDGGCGSSGVCFYNAPAPGVAECAHATGMCACDGTTTYQLDCMAFGYAEAPVPSPTSYVCPVDAGTDARADAAADGG